MYDKISRGNSYLTTIFPSKGTIADCGFVVSNYMTFTNHICVYLIVIGQVVTLNENWSFYKAMSYVILVFST